MSQLVKLLINSIRRLEEQQVLYRSPSVLGCSCRSGEITFLNCGHQRAFFSSPGGKYGEPRWNDIDRRKPKKSEKTCPSATLSTTKPTWTDPGVNPGLRYERSTTIRFSHATA
jgi:hypothetical protein